MPERLPTTASHKHETPEKPEERERAAEPWRDFENQEHKLLAEGGAAYQKAVERGDARKPSARKLAALLVFLSGSSFGAEPPVARAEKEYMPDTLFNEQEQSFSTTKEMSPASWYTSAHAFPSGKLQSEARLAGSLNLSTQSSEYDSTRHKKTPAEYPTSTFEGISLPFDWQRALQSLNARENTENEARIESIRIPEFGNSRVDDALMSSSFYKHLSPLEYGQGLYATSQAVVRSGGKEKGYKLFIDNLKAADLNDQQKLISLQRIGSVLLQTYDTDMIENENYIKVSEEDMLAGIQAYYKGDIGVTTGICGNIHTFLTKTAGELSMDAWLQNGIVGGEEPRAHTWTGLIAKDADGKDQIAFLDYGALIPTGTMDYRLALGVAERHFKQVNLFNSYIGTTDEVIAPVQSLAQETMSRAAGFTGSQSILEQLLRGKSGETQEMAVSMSERETSIRFSDDMLGFTFHHFEDTANPYQALSAMDSLRGSVRFGDKTIGGAAEATLVNMNIKDLGNGVFSQQEIIARLEDHYINTHSMTSEDFGTFAIRYGLTLEAGVRHILNSDLPDFGKFEQSTGAMMLYTDPAKIGTFYIGATDVKNTQAGELQDQEILKKKLSETLTIGGDIKVREGTILNLESRATTLNYGTKQELEAKISEHNKTLRVETGKISSNIPHTIPSTEKLTLEAGYEFGKKPFAEAVIFGAKEKTDYTTTSDKKSEIGIKMRILFW